MTSVNDGLPDHLPALLGQVLDDLRRDLASESAALRADDASDPLRGLRWSQLRLLSLTPRDGLRVTDMADRVGMTKQALGEFANVLEERGLLESVRDPTDRRVRILRPTAQGLQAVAAGDEVIARVEERWRARLGQRRWDQLRRLLREVHENASAP